MSPTSSKIEIAPSLLACDFSKLGAEIKAVEEAGADVIHLDIMDGHFVPNLTFGPPIIEKLRAHTRLPFDAHLMIENADAFIESFAKAGCNWISVHVEACPHINRTLNLIRSLGMKAGVAINPGTSLSSLSGVLDDVDYVLLMSVNPGFGGQKFSTSSTERLRELKEKIGNRSIRIQIDGGIKEDNIGIVAKAGADIMVVGTGIFATSDYKATIQKLKKACGA